MPRIDKQTTRPVKKKSSSVVDRIAPIEFEEDEGIKILLYGKSGSGKTTLWATFPAPILVMVCSGGLRPGELRSIDTPENRKRISQVVLEGVDEVKEIIDHVLESEKYKTIVIDHASGLQDLTLKEILGLDELPAQKSWGLASQQQYGQSTLQCKEVFRAMLNLSCNVVIIAQERVFGNEDADSDLIQPSVGAALSPSLAGWLGPACDYVCQTLIRPVIIEKTKTIGPKSVTTRVRGKGVEYCLRTAPHDIYASKFRVPIGTELPDVIVNPTFAKIKQLINGK